MLFSNWYLLLVYGGIMQGSSFLISGRVADLDQLTAAQPESRNRRSDNQLARAVHRSAKFTRPDGRAWLCPKIFGNLLVNIDRYNKISSPSPQNAKWKCICLDICFRHNIDIHNQLNHHIVCCICSLFYPIVPDSSSFILESKMEEINAWGWVLR